MLPLSIDRPSRRYPGTVPGAVPGLTATDGLPIQASTGNWKLSPAELALAHDPLVAVLGTLHAVLEVMRLARQLANDLVSATWYMGVEPAGHDLHHLTDR